MNTWNSRWPALVAIAAFGVAGCSSQSDREEERYVMMKEAFSPKPELCEQSKKVVAALLEERDQEAYARRKLSSDVECAEAKLGL